MTNAVRPARNLEEIAAGGTDPYSLLAAKLLILDRDQEAPDRKELLGRAQAAVDGARSKQLYARLGIMRVDDEEVAELLRDAALAAMDALELQREESS